MENQSTEEIATAQASVGKQKPSKDAVGSFPLLTPRHQAGQWVFSSALPTGNSKPAPMPETSSDSRLSWSGGCQRWEGSSQPNQLALEPAPLIPGEWQVPGGAACCCLLSCLTQSPSPRESPSPPKGRGEPPVHHVALVCSSQGWGV